ncbi:MAG: mechanosensitive ion channel family protein [Hyphomicrobiaceae bacterium]
MSDSGSIDLFTKLLNSTQDINSAVGVWLAGATIAALVMYFVARLLTGQLVKRQVAGHRTLERTYGPLALGAVLLWLWLAAPAGDFAPVVYNVLEHGVHIGVVVLCGWLAVIVIGGASAYFTTVNRSSGATNLQVRRSQTQISILQRAAEIVVGLATIAGILMTFPAVRHIGISIFASAGAAGLVIGLAARPILSNLIAGIQIAITQPIRLDDVVIVEGQWGTIEEVTSTYVVVRIWDLRRLIVPLSHFIEKPFENWTRTTADLLGQVIWHLDYRAPVEDMRQKLEEIVSGDRQWDGKVARIQVTETDRSTIVVRALVSARDSSDLWDLRCTVRERMLAWLKDAHPEALPRSRAEMSDAPRAPNPVKQAVAVTNPDH